VRQHPDAVIVLDEIEKAHSDFARALLTVFGEYGTVYDPRTGRDYPAANATFILTSNLAKELILRHPIAVAKTQGRFVETWQKLPAAADGDPDCAGYAKLREAVDAELSNPPPLDREHSFFRESEIRGRLTDVLPFLPFGPHEVEEAVRGFLAAESKAFSEHPGFANVELAWSPEVVRFFASLYAKKPDEGLRAVNKELQAQVRDLLERAVEAGLVARGAVAALRVDEGAREPRLDLRAVPREVMSPAPAPRLDLEAAVAEEESETFLSTIASFLGGDWVNESMESMWSWTGEKQPTTTNGELEQPEWDWLTEWDWQTDWDWQRIWERLFVMLWEWRFPLVVTAALLVVVASASMAAPMAPVTATVTASSTLGTGGAVSATAMAVSSWALALVQVTGSSASVAVPGLTFYYAWKNRHYVEAAIFAALFAAVCPYAWRVYCTALHLARQAVPKQPARLLVKSLAPRAPSKKKDARQPPGGANPPPKVVMDGANKVLQDSPDLQMVPNVQKHEEDVQDVQEDTLVTQDSDLATKCSLDGGEAREASQSPSESVPSSTATPPCRQLPSSAGCQSGESNGD